MNIHSFGPRPQQHSPLTIQALTPLAAILWPDVPDCLNGSRHIVKIFRDLLADSGQGEAVGAGLLFFWNIMNHLNLRERGWQLFPPRLLSGMGWNFDLFRLWLHIMLWHVKGQQLADSGIHLAYFALPAAKKAAEAVIIGIIDLLSCFKNWVHTITLDNGKEVCPP